MLIRSAKWVCSVKVLKNINISLKKSCCRKIHHVGTMTRPPILNARKYKPLCRHMLIVNIYLFGNIINKTTIFQMQKVQFKRIAIHITRTDSRGTARSLTNFCRNKYSRQKNHHGPSFMAIPYIRRVVQSNKAGAQPARNLLLVPAGTFLSFFKVCDVPGGGSQERSLRKKALQKEITGSINGTQR